MALTILWIYIRSLHTSVSVSYLLLSSVEKEETVVLLLCSLIDL